MTNETSSNNLKSSKSEQEAIKSAVVAEPSEDSESSLHEEYSETPSQAVTQEYPGMQQSVMSPGYEDSAQQQPSSQGAEEYQGYEQPQQPQDRPQAQEYAYQNQQDQYSAYQPMSISPDTINEVAEQVVAEKLGPIATSVEKLFDQKATFEAQIQYLDDRLKRIEKIIDRLQLSLLQKVGEYVTNVDDIKREMIETQKSFKSMWDQKENQRRPINSKQ